MYDFEDLDYYELLGVARTASPEDIRRAYRREMSKYHPDRYTGAAPDEQLYAGERSQRINEAYRVLNDFRARSDYNRQHSRPTRQPRETPPQQRDHQAELYAQAQSHMAAGRQLQALAALRELQRINPLYRDSADLLEQVRQRLDHSGARSAAPGRSRRLLLFGAGGSALAVGAALAWTFLRSPGTPTGQLPTTQPAVTSQPVLAASPQPSVTPLPLPTDLPLVTPTAVPTVPPSPTVLPTATPAPTATTVPTPPGRLLVNETFDQQSWAQQAGNGWSVGYANNGYVITADTNVGTVWSFRTAPQVEARQYAVDAQITGEGGLLLDFVDANNYLLYSLLPAETRFQVVLVRGGRSSVLASGTNTAIQASAEAVNRMEALVQPGLLTLGVNGSTVVEISDLNLGENRRYGLFAFGSERASVARFDNLEIRAATP